MTVFGICLVKNAGDIIGPIMEHMVKEVDHVIVYDNMSSDGTRYILESFDATIIDDLDPAYNQSDKTTEMAQLAMRMGADWVVPFDSDEWWTSSKGTLKESLKDITAPIVIARMFNHFPTAIDPNEWNPIKRIGWREADSQALFKVACKTHDTLVIEVGNHHAHYGNDVVQNDSGLIEVHHFPWRDSDQFVRKALEGARALKLANLPEDVGKHWRDYSKLVEEYGEDALRDVYSTYFFKDDPVADGLVYDPLL